MLEKNAGKKKMLVEIEERAGRSVSMHFSDKTFPAFFFQHFLCIKTSAQQKAHPLFRIAT